MSNMSEQILQRVNKLLDISVEINILCNSDEQQSPYAHALDMETRIKYI